MPVVCLRIVVVIFCFQYRYCQGMNFFAAKALCNNFTEEEVGILPCVAGCKLFGCLHLMRVGVFGTRRLSGFSWRLLSG